MEDFRVIGLLKARELGMQRHRKQRPLFSRRSLLGLRGGATVDGVRLGEGIEMANILRSVMALVLQAVVLEAAYTAVHRAVARYRP